MEGEGSILTPFVQILVDLGLPGLLIAALGWHDWQVQKRNMALIAALMEITKEAIGAQKAGESAIRDNTSQIKDLSTLVQNMLLRGKPE